jgi:hypothetical protein
MESTRACRYLLLVLGVSVWGQRVLGDQPEKYALQPQSRIGQVDQVQVSVQVGGDLKLVTEGKSKTLPMSVVATLKYDEQLLAVDDAQRPARSVRFYDESTAVIKVDKGGQKPTLDKGRRLVVAEQPSKSAAAALYCPASALTREELDLIDVPGNTLLVNSLLPVDPVAVGEAWKLADQTLAELLGLEAVSFTDVKSVLEGVDSGIAQIAAGGAISGAVGGVSTEIQFKAKYKFDLGVQRVTYLAMLIKEKRAVGHVGPGLDTVAKVIVRVTPTERSASLTDEVVKSLPPAMTPKLSRLSYSSIGGQFRFLYDRRWVLTSDDPKLAVFRLVDRGELVAQCNVSAVPATQARPVALTEFQRDIQNSLGTNFGQFVSASQSTSEAGYTILRVVAHGVVSQLPIEWIYYLIADDKGGRVSLAFTLEESLQERFDKADRSFASVLRIAPAAKTAVKPAPKQSPQK